MDREHDNFQLTPAFPMSSSKKAVHRTFIFKDHIGRLALFVLAVFIASSWTTRHLGAVEWFAFVVNGMTVLFGIVGLLTHVSNEPDEEKFRRLLQKGLLFFLKIPLLVGIYLVLTIVSLTVTSVTVYAIDDEGGSIMISDSRGDSQETHNIIPGERSVTTLLITNPFGTTYTVGAEGYFAHPVEIYPFFGKRIWIGQDLRLLPTALVRLMIQPAELDSGFITLRVGESVVDTITMASAGQNAILIGHERAIPSELRYHWENVLNTQAPGSKGIAFRARMLEGWSNPVFGKILVTEPGVRIEISAYNSARSPIVRQMIVIAEEPFQDYLLNAL